LVLGLVPVLAQECLPSGDMLAHAGFGLITGGLTSAASAVINVELSGIEAILAKGLVTGAGNVIQTIGEHEMLSPNDPMPNIMPGFVIGLGFGAAGGAMDEFGNYVGRNVKIPTYEAPRGMYGLRAQEIKPSSYDAAAIFFAKSFSSSSNFANSFISEYDKPNASYKYYSPVVAK
jgi:hypothetical protein